MKNVKFLSLIAGLVMLSACGSQSSRDSQTSSSNNTSSTNTGVNVTGSNPYNLPYADSVRVQLSGNNGGAFSQSLYYNTSATLRVKVEALAAPNLTVNGYGGWVFPYGCMSVTVTVNGIPKSTMLLKVAGNTQTNSACKDSPSSQILSFSSSITGTGPVSVTFSNAQYDNCRGSYPYSYGNGCPTVAVWQNHQVALNATVQTDDTFME